MPEQEICQHLTIHKQADGAPANRIHNGPERAFRCGHCGAIFFVNLKPAEISVSYGMPSKEKTDGK